MNTENVFLNTEEGKEFANITIPTLIDSINRLNSNIENLTTIICELVDKQK